jgi:hypothetical protein
VNKILFPGLAWLLLLLIPITFWGFYPSYFAKLFSMQLVYHAHAFFMILWVAMAIAQPFIIRQKKTKLHKAIGKTSYLIMPMLFISSYIVIQHTYYNFISTQAAELEAGNSTIAMEKIYSDAAAYIMIGVVYIIWLFVFYVLAVINRKKMLNHATYMFAAILTLLGPTVDRIMYQITMYFGGSFNVFVENAVFVSILLILTGLILYQNKKEISIKPASIALSIYIAGIIAYHLLPKTSFWNLFVKMVM